jgi:protein-serine/threonine kinase
MTLALPPTRASSVVMNSGPSSPTLNFTEDLTRFPSESLHSFSFAHQSEDFIYNRQNILKRSVEFMSQKLGWNANNAGIASAQARVSGDQEMQGMLELLARAKLVGANNLASHSQTHLGGPLTGPAAAEDAMNVFDMSFMPRSQSPEIIESPGISPATTRKAFSIGESIPEQIDSSKDTPALTILPESDVSSGTLTNESQTTSKTSPPVTRRQSLRRTYTDTAPLSLQTKLMDALAQPYVAGDTLNDLLLSPTLTNAGRPSSFILSASHHLPGPAVHGHSSRWAPAAQAIFTTEISPPYTILAANDLACLVFGVTKAEVRKMGILEVVRAERRAWLAERLESPGSATDSGKHATPPSPQSKSQQASTDSASSTLLSKVGLTASLLSKPNSRQTPKSPIRRAQTDDGAGSGIAARTKAARGGSYHPSKKSRGVLLCGDVVPIQKRNGATGSASLWVKEKRGGLIWVLEEIHEDVAYIGVDDDANVSSIAGSTEEIWGEHITTVGMDIGRLLPRLPRQGIDGRSGEIDYAEVTKRRYFTARNPGHVNVPCMVERVPGGTDLQVSSFPHIAGIMVLSAQTLKITSSNSVFSAALFGQEKPDGRPVTDLIPDFDRMLKVLTEHDEIHLVDGMVIPEHSFRRARAFLALQEGKEDTESFFLRPDGLPARHRDGSEIKIDAQLRVVQSDPTSSPTFDDNVIEEGSDEEDGVTVKPESQPELVYALWITYSRYIHANRQNIGQGTPLLAGSQTPLHQPSPGQTGVANPIDMDSDDSRKGQSHASMLAAQLRAVAKKTAARVTGRELPPTPHEKTKESKSEESGHSHKKSIDDFTILEEMGQGAYGQVKLARYKRNGNKKMVLKYVTKRRILVDTWTRDRKLGTVPLEIHVLDYLRRDGLRHPNIVEMVDFFEDDVNYYIEMLPHGLPGMDLFDYIELRVNMTEDECRSIFGQVAKAIHHLHTKALVVHRDIKDENVVLDGEGNIKLIDFGSAAYTKNGPFDVFVGTIGKFPRNHSDAQV